MVCQPCSKSGLHLAVAHGSYSFTANSGQTSSRMPVLAVDLSRSSCALGVIFAALEVAATCNLFWAAT